MGEIGIPRREFLYDLRFWEVRRIKRGYRQRDHLKHQLLAECVYAATFSMRDPQGKTVEDMFPDLFKEEYYTEEENAVTDLTDEEIAEMQEFIKSINTEKE